MDDLFLVVVYLVVIIGIMTVLEVGSRIIIYIWRMCDEQDERSIHKGGRVSYSYRVGGKGSK